MEYNNRQVDAYMDADRKIKFHQEKTLNFLKELPASETILDIGCSDGFLLEQVANLFPSSFLHGVEINPLLFEAAKKRLGKNAHVTIHHDDILLFNPSVLFDCIIAEGVLSIFDDPFVLLEKWLNWLTDQGTLIIFGIFSPEMLDFKFYFRKPEKSMEWETGLNGFSIEMIKKFLSNKGYQFCFYPFQIESDLPKTDDPIRGYTAKIDGVRKTIVAQSLIKNSYHLVVKRK